MKKILSILLAFTIAFTGTWVLPAGSMETKAEEPAANVIEISSAEDLAKIGKDPAFPMNGDYELAGDIDLSSIGNWTPIGGAYGPEYGLVSGERVFSGTFDGKGHAIQGLTIQYDGSQNGANTNVSGLFAMIGSDLKSDYAEVKNLLFTDVSIVHKLGGGDTIGALTGDVNGFVKIENIAVLSGSITVNGGNTVYGKPGDLIGAGGIVGQTRRNMTAVQMSHLYNAASLTISDSVANEQVRCGGIIGRIHQDSVIGSLSSSVNTGTVTFRGNLGYAINGCSGNNTAADANTKNITNCYYLEGSGVDMGASTEKSKTALASPEVVDALGADYWTLDNGNLIPQISLGVMVIPIPSPKFAEGDKASSVTQNFNLPLSFVSEEGEEIITWTSDKEDVVSIDSETGLATVHGVLANTPVVLSASTSISKRTKTVKITVVSQLELSFDQEYAKPGTEMTASVLGAPEGTAFTYSWLVDKTEVATTASYTPEKSDLNKFITARAMIDGNLAAEKKIYCSKLPVVYINTNDGYGVTSKTEYKAAYMHIQGNDTFNKSTTLYDGGISIRGRGNSTWNTGFTKLPYKIKLDKKTDLMGFGKSKHWALLANFMDESLIRNTTSYDLSGKMGMPYLRSTHVELIFNGTYAGNYQLVGNVRIEESRVNIHNWEETAEDVAKAIVKAEKANGTNIDSNALEDYLNENMQWITSDSVAYGEKTYKVSDYYTEIPKTVDGKVDVSGGFLFELDTYFDEISKFATTHGQPIMFKNPEFIRPTYGRGYENLKEITENNDSYQKCDALYNYARQYMQAVEDSIHSPDFYVEIQKDGNVPNASNFTEDYKGKQHYTDLVDMDSLVKYLLLNEFYWNTETMKKSTFMYKDLGGKLYIGPVWDMDWTSNSLVSQQETSKYDVWMVKTAENECQTESWYRYLIGDPYFVEKLYECYQENKSNFENIVETGGIIDQDKEYLAESAASNFNYGFLQHYSDFNTETERLRTFLKNRLDWMDNQFASLDTLIASLGKYKASSNAKVTVDTSGETTTKYTAELTESSAKKAGFYINGKLAGTADVTNGKAEFTASDSYLEAKQNARNLVQVRAMDETGSLLSDGAISNYAIFSKELKVPDLTGTVRILGSLKAGSVLKADVSDSNNTGDFIYQWLVNDAPVTGAVSETYRPTKNDIGKRVKVEVSSSFEQGKLPSGETDAITELSNDHLIINQVYGGGNNDATPVSHSFIELYNPTDSAISLSGYSLGYLSNGKNGKAAEEARLALDDASIPSHASYLIRCEAQDTATFTGKLTIEDYDQEWTDRIIDNKQYKIVLYKGAKMEDAVSVNEEMTEGLALPDKTISKQKGIRRQAFADTDNNTEDFTVIEYNTASAAVIQAYRPRSLKDGAWQAEEPAAPTELTGTVSIRGNAIAGAILYADTLLENDEDGTLAKTLSYQWMADGNAITDVSGQFLKLTEKDAGKKFSVKVTSGSIDGELTYAMETAVQIVEAQREHLIINQVYGGGGKTEPPVSHSFIELYNPTSQAVSLDGYSLKYMSSSSADEEAKELSLSGSIPARTSYLIRCKAETNAKGFAYEIKDSDASWDLTISNKQYRVTLKKGESNVDGVSVNEEASEGTALLDPAGDTIISKNKSVRRIEFIDTDDNAADFETLNYSKLPAALLADVAPRSAKDGAWGLPAKPDENNPDEKDKADEILLSAANTALTEADGKEQSKYDAKDYEKLAAAKKALSDALKTGKKSEIELALQNLKDVLKTIKEKTASDQEPPNDETPKKGESFLYKKGWYKITKMAQSGGTATYVKPAGKGYKTISIPKEAVYAGIKFKVTEIAKNAMKNNKKLQKVIIGENVTKIGASAFMGDKNLKNIQIKSKALKSVGKNALKNVHAKCKIKVPKKKLNDYKKKLKKKGQKNSVKIVK